MDNNFNFLTPFARQSDAKQVEDGWRNLSKKSANESLID